MRGIIGFLMLIPLFLVFALAFVVSMLPFVLAIWVVGDYGQKGGLWRLLGVVASLVIGGICFGLGYWFANEVSIEPMLSLFYSEVSFPFIDWIFPLVFPILGWIDMVGGGLIAVIGIWSTLFGKRADNEAT